LLFDTASQDMKRFSGISVFSLHDLVKSTTASRTSWGTQLPVIDGIDGIISANSFDRKELLKASGFRWSYDEVVKALNRTMKNHISTTGIIIPKVGYHDIYGVWFFGQLKGIIRQIGTERFGVELGNMMHVYVDLEPMKIGTGIHDITVYDHPCRLPPVLWYLLRKGLSRRR
jgi:hypothetical protein